jgi:hypothetical protein
MYPHVTTLNNTMTECFEKMMTRLLPTIGASLEERMFHLEKRVSDLYTSSLQNNIPTVAKLEFNESITSIEAALRDNLDLFETVFERLARVESKKEHYGNQECSTGVDNYNEQDKNNEILEVNAAQSSVPGRKRKIQDQRGYPSKKSDTEYKVTEDLTKNFIGKSEGELLAELLKREKERKLAQKKSDYLTAEEQEMGQRDLGELDCFWRENAGYDIRDSDRENIGNLSHDQVTLPRRNIREIIQARRTENYIRRMKARGREVVKCVNCERAYELSKGHQCLSTSWRTSTLKQGLPAEKRIIISQTGSGAVQIGQRTTLDLPKMEKAYRRLDEIRRAEEGKRSFIPTQDHDIVVEVENDNVMGQQEETNNNQVVAANQIYIQEDQNLSSQRNFHYGEILSALQ